MGVYETADPATKAKVSAFMSSSVHLFAEVSLVSSACHHFIISYYCVYVQVLQCGKYKDVTECGVRAPLLCNHESVNASLVH